MDARRAFIGVRDRDALAPDVVEPDVVFLLDALTQILHGHVFLRKFDVNRAAALLQINEQAAIFTQRFLSRADVALLRLLLAKQPGGLAIHLFAVVRQLFDQAARFLNFELGLVFARHKRRTFATALFDDLGQLTHSLFERLLLLLVG
jgi:hypothetical protein